MVIDQALADGGIQIAVAHQCTTTGKADLTTVGVTRENEIRAVLDESVQGPQVRGVRHTDAQGGGVVTGRCLRESGVAVIRKVRIVHTREIEHDVSHAQTIVAIDQARPPGGVECAVHLLGGQPRVVRRIFTGRGPPQVPEGILGLGRKVAVGARHVHTRELEQGAHDLQQVRQRAQVRKVVTGVDHQIRSQCRQRLDKAPLGLLAGDRVQVREVQDAQRPGAGG